MRIYYGIEGNYKDITYLALTKCVVGLNGVTIPSGDGARSNLFGDHLFNVLKHIKVVDGDIVTIYDDKSVVQLSIETYLNKPLPLFKAWHLNFENTKKQLEFIHNNMLFNGGRITDEYPEQLLITKYLNPNAKVLEIGANYGRSTLTIAALLEDERNLVSLECDPTNFLAAQVNRNLNNYKFHMERSALSARKLFQKGWNTYTEDVRPIDATEISTITWSELQQKYDIVYDTLIADCEGALYYILKDAPSLLDNIKMIIVENDYANMDLKHEVDEIYQKAGLSLVESNEGGWGPNTPCLSCFYEVWMRK